MTQAYSYLTGVKDVIWLDGEMTGLDPLIHRLLEIAVADPTDGVCDVPEAMSFQVFTPTVPEGTDPYVVKMHTEGELWEACANPETTLTLDALDAALCERYPLTKEDNDNRLKYLLAGNTIHFDLGFLQKNLPLFAARLHYRLLDVSSVLIACELAGMPALELGPKAHRAAEDVFASVDKLAACMRWMLEGKPEA